MLDWRIWFVAAEETVIVIGCLSGVVWLVSWWVGWWPDWPFWCASVAANYALAFRRAVHRDKNRQRRKAIVQTFE